MASLKGALNPSCQAGAATLPFVVQLVQAPGVGDPWLLGFGALDVGGGVAH